MDSAIVEGGGLPISMPAELPTRIKQLEDDTVLKFSLANRLAVKLYPRTIAAFKSDLSQHFHTLSSEKILELALLIYDTRQASIVEDQPKAILTVLCSFCPDTPWVDHETLVLKLSQLVSGSYVKKSILPVIRNAMYKTGQAHSIRQASKEADILYQEIMAPVRAESIELTLSRFQKVLHEDLAADYPAEVVASFMISTLFASHKATLFAKVEGLEDIRLTEMIVYMNSIDYSEAVTVPDATQLLQNLGETAFSDQAYTLALEVNDMALFLKGVQITAFDLKQKLINFDVLEQHKLTPFKKFNHTPLFPTIESVVNSKIGFDIKDIMRLQTQLKCVFPAILDAFMVHLARFHHYSSKSCRKCLEDVLIPGWKKMARDTLKLLEEVGSLARYTQHLISDERKTGDWTPWREFGLVPGQDVSIDDTAVDAPVYEILVSTGWQTVPFRHPIHKVFGSPWSKWLFNLVSNKHQDPRRQIAVDIPHTSLAFMNRTSRTYSNLMNQQLVAVLSGVRAARPVRSVEDRTARLVRFARATGIPYGARIFDIQPSSETIPHLDRPEFDRRIHMYPTGRITFESLNSVLTAVRFADIYAPDMCLDDAFIRQEVLLPTQLGLWRLQPV